MSDTFCNSPQFDAEELAILLSALGEMSCPYLDEGHTHSFCGGCSGYDKCRNLETHMQGFIDCASVVDNHSGDVIYGVSKITAGLCDICISDIGVCPVDRAVKECPHNVVEKAAYEYFNGSD